MKHERLDYLDYISLEKGLSKNSVEAYRRDIIQFEQYLQGKNLTQWSEVTLNSLAEYLESLSHYKESSVIRKLTAIKNFLYYLYTSKVLMTDISEHLTHIKRQALLFDALTLEEVEKILGAIGNSWSEKRDRMIIEFLLFTGARVSEVVELAIEDIDFDACTLRIMAKGSKQRVLPLTFELVDKVKHYLLDVRVNLKNREAYKLFNIDRKYFWVRLKKYGEKGLGKSIHPHLFRHTVASELLSSGANIRIVQELLGHKSIATTQIYTHVEKNKIKKLYDEVKIGDE